MSYEKKPISYILGEIEAKHIYLPAIQRKYVWTEEQIIKLMDSIMRGYPFGTFLFWNVKKTVINKKEYSLYEFIKDYHARDLYVNPKASFPFDINPSNVDETIYSVLDGQQRLTSLYIALKGSLSLKIPKKHWSNNDAFPKKELYFDLNSGSLSVDDEEEYVFRFLTEEEAMSISSKVWYKVKDILQYTNSTDVMTELINKNEWNTNKTVMNNVLSLFKNLKESELINYFEVFSDSIDDVLEIFVRVNSGGTVLSKTDLLFSTIVSSWDKARDEIDNLLTGINKIGDHYNFSNDFIMRTCLYLIDLPTTLKVESFVETNVKQIKLSWHEFKKSIKETVNLLNELGFNSENIVSYNAIIPLIYYRQKNGKDAFNGIKEEIRKYLVVAQVNQIFGQSTNTTLVKLRDEIKKHHDKFNLTWFKGLVFSGDKTLTCSADDIENWFDVFEKGPYTFMLLSLLYPNLKYSQNGFHQDHMHPRSAFDNETELKSLVLPNGSNPDLEKIKEWQRQRNTLANLQLLEGRENEAKNADPLMDWLADPGNKQQAKYLPKTDYKLANFDKFLSLRKDIMSRKLKKILL